MKKLTMAGLAALLVVLAGCATSGAEPTPTVTITVPGPTTTIFVTPTPTPSRTAEDPLDLTTDAGLCAADAEMTNLELNDAIAPMLGYPADRDLRTFEQDQAIREHKNAAFLRACPARAS